MEKIAIFAISVASIFCAWKLYILSLRMEIIEVLLKRLIEKRKNEH